VWSLNQDAGAIAAICFATGRAAMLHIEQHFECVFNNLMRPASSYVSYETHATSVVLMSRIIETLF